MNAHSFVLNASSLAKLIVRKIRFEYGVLAVLILLSISFTSNFVPVMQAGSQSKCPPTDCTAGKNVDRAFFEGVIKQLSPETKVTDFAVDALMTWKPHENTNACWNPMATTQRMKGSCDFNSVGVQHFMTKEDGIAATAITLNLHYYDSIREMLREEKFDKEAMRKSLKTWGTCTQPTCALLDEWETLWNNRETINPEEPEPPVAIPDNPEDAAVIDEQSTQFKIVKSGQKWQEAAAGYQNHIYWMAASKQSESVGRWTLKIDKAGLYHVYVYIPAVHATATSAKYSIQHNKTKDTITIQQNEHNNEWLKIGTYHFSGEGVEYVELSNRSDSAFTLDEIAFDAISIQYKEDSQIEKTWKDFLQKINDWWNQQWKTVQEKVDDWIQKQLDSVKHDFNQWLREFTNRLLLRVQSIIVELAQQCCGSISLIFIVIATPLLLSIMKRY